MGQCVQTFATLTRPLVTFGRGTVCYCGRRSGWRLTIHAKGASGSYFCPPFQML